MGTIVAVLLLPLPVPHGLWVGSSFSPVPSAPLAPRSSVKQVGVSKLWGVCKNLCKIE